MFRMPFSTRSRTTPRATFVIGISALLCGALTLPAAAASAISPTQTDDAGSLASAEVELTMAPEAPVFTADDDSYTFTVQIENHRAFRLSAGSLRLALNPERITAAAQLHADFGDTTATMPDAGGEAGAEASAAESSAIVIGESVVGETNTDDTQIVEVTVPRSELTLTAGDPAGVYRVQATLVADRSDRHETLTSLTADTSFVWQGVADARTDLAVIVPLVLPTSVQSMPTRRQLNAAIPDFEALLDAAEDARATLAIDPRIIASIRASGDEAPQATQRFLRRLESTTLQSFLLQFADADPAAQAALGYTELLQPLGLEYLTSQGSFPTVTTRSSEAPAAGSDADATGADATGGDAPAEAEAEPDDADTPDDADEEADDTVTTEPTLAELLAWPQQQTAMAWPADGQVDSATIDLLTTNGITDTVLSSDNVALSGGPRATLGAGNALIANAALGRATQAALLAESETELRSATADAASLLAVSAQNGGSSVLLTLDRAAVADTTEAAAVLADVLALDWVTPTPTDALTAGEARLTAAAPLEVRREMLRSAANQEPNVAAVSVLLEQPEFLIGYQRTRLLDLFATHYAHDPAAFAGAMQTYSDRDAELSLGVRTISTEHTQLVGSSTRVPVQVKNALPFTAIVNLRVAPDSAALSIPEREFTDVTVSGEGNSSVLVPVKSRVSTGESALTLSVTDVSGEYVSDTNTLSVTIRSGIETIGMWVLGVLAAFLLLVGTVRSLRRRRRRAAAAETETETETEEPSQETDPSAEN